MNMAESLAHISSTNAADGCFTFWVFDLLHQCTWLEMWKLQHLWNSCSLSLLQKIKILCSKYLILFSYSKTGAQLSDSGFQVTLKKIWKSNISYNFSRVKINIFECQKVTRFPLKGFSGIHLLFTQSATQHIHLFLFMISVVYMCIGKRSILNSFLFVYWAPCGTICSKS